MAIRRINPPELGTPPGYSQIVEVSAGRMIFIAGQTALDRDGNLIGKDDFAAQATQVFSNLTIALIPEYEDSDSFCVRRLNQAIPRR